MNIEISMTEKMRHIGFRCNEGLHDFLLKTSRSNGILISDLVRMMLQSYYIMWLFGKMEPYPKLRKKFKMFFDEIEKTDDREILEYLKSKQTIPLSIFRNEIDGLNKTKAKIKG